MKRKAIGFLILCGVLVSCKSATIKTQSSLSSSPTASVPSTITPSPSFTPLPSLTPTFPPTPAPVLVSSPAPVNTLVLERFAQLGGSISGITIVGDTAFVGMGPRVAAIDISDHQNPQLISQSKPLPGMVTQLLQVSGGPLPLLLVNAGKYLVLVDTSNPDEIKPINQLELAGVISAMVWDARVSTLYVGGSIYETPYRYTGFIVTVDITLDDHLKLLNSVAMPEQPTSLALGEGSLFAGTEGDKAGLYHIQIEDLGELSTPHLVIAPSSENNNFAPVSMQVIGDRLYAGSNMDLQVYDITDPDQPEQAWTEFVGLMPKGFSVNGAQVDIFGWVPAGTYIPAHTALTPPEPVTGDPVGQVASIVTVHNTDFLVAYHDLEIYAAGGTQGIELVGSYQPPVITVLDAASDEHAVYLVDNGVGDGRSPATLRVFSLPDLQPLGHVATSVTNSWGWFSGLAVEGDRAYLAAIDGLWAYDLSSPSPTLLNKLDIIDGQLKAIAAAKLGDRRILILSQDSSDLSTLAAYDLTDIQKPVRMSSPLTLERGTILQMTWDGSTLYAVLTAIYENDNDMLYVISLDGDALVLQGKIPLTGYIFSLAVENGLVVVAGTHGLTLVSAADARSPRILSEIPLPELGLEVAILEDTVLVINGGNNGAAQLVTFDIQDPANPRQVKSVDLAFSNSLIGPIPAVKPYLVLANGSAGVEVFDYSFSSTGSVVCLDEQARPLAVPPHEKPLEIRFISSGNIWLWDEGTPARQVTDTGDALNFTFSPDGQVIAFERVQGGEYPWGQFKIELWAINRDSKNLRQLVSIEKFDDLLPGRDEAWAANVPTDYRWFSGTHELSFGVYPYINAVGAGTTAEGYWVVDTDSGALKKWEHPDVIDPYGPKKISSPDGKVIAVVDRESISLMNANGSIIRRDALVYPVMSNGEGPGWGAPKVVWTSDSQLLRVLVWDEGDFDRSFSVWEIPADGSPSRKIHVFKGMWYYSFISPDQDYIAYLHRVREGTNEHELHLAKLDGSEDIIYIEDYLLYFEGWAPDSYHFVYDMHTNYQPQLGSICGGHEGLVESKETPATQITWVDAEHFLFVVGEEGQPRELRLGQVGGKSVLIGPFKGERSYFEIKQEGQDVYIP